MKMRDIPPINPLIPILIIGFNRPKNLNATLAALDLEVCSKIYISLDGPRNEYDAKQQEEIANVISKFKKQNRIEVVVNQQKHNLGCALGVVHAINWFFSHEPSGLVLEDDLLISPDFFPLLKTFLEEADLNRQVFSAYAPFETSDLEHQYWKSKYLFISGWYLSKKLWTEAAEDMFRFHFPYLRNHEGQRRDLEESVFWWAACMRVIMGFTDTWDCVFYDSFWRKGFSCFVPRQNLVLNTGFDEFGTHTKDIKDDLGVRHENNYGKIVNSGDLDSYAQRYYFRIKTKHILTPVLSLLLKIFVNLVNREPRIQDQKEKIHSFARAK